jgi:hypothetical protein
MYYLDLSVYKPELTDYSARCSKIWAGPALEREAYLCYPAIQFLRIFDSGTKMPKN